MGRFGDFMLPRAEQNSSNPAPPFEIIVDVSSLESDYRFDSSFSFHVSLPFLDTCLYLLELN